MHFQHVLTACGVFPRQMQTACHIISSCSLVSYPFPCYFPWLRNFRFALLAKNCLNSLLFNNLRCSTNLVKLYKNNCFMIRNTRSVRMRVLETSDRMRTMLKTGEEEANSSFANCRNCICDQTVCEYSYNNE